MVDNSCAAAAHLLAGRVAAAHLLAGRVAAAHMVVDRGAVGSNSWGSSSYGRLWGSKQNLVGQQLIW